MQSQLGQSIPSTVFSHFRRDRERETANAVIKSRASPELSLSLQKRAVCYSFNFGRTRRISTEECNRYAYILFFLTKKKKKKKKKMRCTRVM